MDSINQALKDELKHNINEMSVNRLTTLTDYLAETLDADDDTQVNLSLNGMSFNIYTKCAACEKSFPNPVIVLEDGNGTAHVVDSDCRANVNLEDED